MIPALILTIAAVLMASIPAQLAADTRRTREAAEETRLTAPYAPPRDDLTGLPPVPRRAPIWTAPLPRARFAYANPYRAHGRLRPWYPALVEHFAWPTATVIHIGRPPEIARAA